MNKINRLTLAAVIALTIVFPLVTAAQETAVITLTDLQNFRKAVADAAFWEKTAKDKDEQIAEANKSAANWKGLYLSEKDRADRVQERRATEATAAATDFQGANVFLREQNTDLKREKRELEDDLVSCKSSRKYYFFGGLATGAAGGTYIGYKIGKSSGIPGLGDQALPQARPQFGFKLKF